MAGAIGFGFVFGWLLQRGGVTDYNVVVNQFRFRDFTVLKVMLTAVVVGGIGVAALHSGGLANYQIKAAPMLVIVLGAAIFGVGMVIYGYCPGTNLHFPALRSGHRLFQRPSPQPHLQIRHRRPVVAICPFRDPAGDGRVRGRSAPAPGGEPIG